MNDLEKKLISGYKFLKRAQANSYLAERYSVEAKHNLELAKADALASGEIQGKNPGERETSARGLFPVHYQLVEKETEKASGARIRLTVAQLEVDLCRALIRIEEIQIGRLPDAGH